MSKNKPVWRFPAIILTAALMAPGLVNVSRANAFFADADSAVNNLGFGINTIVPEEEFEEPEPGQETCKNPKAVNTGNVPCYVRAKVFLSDSRIALDYEDYLNTGAWRKEDGWYYYNGILQPGETTPALFDRILLMEDIPEEVQEAQLNVVFASVQSEGFDDAAGAFASLAH